MKIWNNIVKLTKLFEVYIYLYCIHFENTKYDFSNFSAKQNLKVSYNQYISVVECFNN